MLDKLDFRRFVDIFVTPTSFSDSKMRLLRHGMTKRILVIRLVYAEPYFLPCHSLKTHAGTFETTNDQPTDIDDLVGKVKMLVESSVREGVAALHLVEEQLLEKLLQLGHAALQAIFQSLGQGDVGPTLAHPEHK